MKKIINIALTMLIAIWGISCSQVSNFESGLGESTNGVISSTQTYDSSQLGGKYTAIAKFSNGGTVQVTYNGETNIVDASGKIIWGGIQGNYFNSDGLNLYFGPTATIFTCTVEANKDINCAAQNITMDGGSTFEEGKVTFTYIDATNSVVTENLVTTTGTLAIDGSDSDWDTLVATFSDNSSDSAVTGSDIQYIKFAKSNSGDVAFFISLKDTASTSVEYRVTLSNSTYSKIQLDFSFDAVGGAWKYSTLVNQGTGINLNTDANLPNISISSLPVPPNFTPAANIEFTISLSSLIGGGTAITSDFTNMMIKVETRATTGDTTYDSYIPQKLFNY